MNEVTKSFGDITVDNVKVALNGKKNQAQLRQVVTTTYPAGHVGNSLNDTIFGAEDFGYGKGQTFESTRIAWMDVPLSLDPEDKDTVAKVQSAIDNFPKARIYKILSLKPILTEEQKSWMMNLNSKEERDEFLAKVKEAQIVRDSEENIVHYKGQTQYAVNYFSKNGQPDVDTREKELAGITGELVEGTKVEKKELSF